MICRRLVLSMVFVLLLVPQAFAQALPARQGLPPGLRPAPPPQAALAAVPPEAVGLSSERLERLKAVMQQHVDQGRIAGVVTLIARGGRLAHFETYGKMDAEQNRPMRKDVIL
ncbi:MAG TPA: serine hydrolase, partial [Vicinamibacterales bacterium]|nr:serine hydrolase [Vicinamibacterales bacterium]